MGDRWKADHYGRSADPSRICRDWFAGHNLSLTDIALYACAHVAEDGGMFALADYPAEQRWIARVEAEPGFVAMAA